METLLLLKFPIDSSRHQHQSSKFPNNVTIFNVVYVVFTINFVLIVINCSLTSSNKETMRPISIWPFFLGILGLNADKTLEFIYQKFNDLEIEMNTLKVTISKYYCQNYGPLDHLCQANLNYNELRMKTWNSEQMLNF